MSEPFVLLVVFAVFFLAGCVKGTIGMGLPLVTVGLLTAFIGLKPALALLLVPSFLTNVWQSFAGEHTRAIFRRFWPLFIATMLFTWPGTFALARVNVAYLTALLGSLLIAYAAISLSRLKFEVPKTLEGRLNPLVGAISGVLAGMTGVFTVPGVAYLQSTGLNREELIQAMGMLFTLATIGLSISLGGQNLLTAQLGLVSLAAVIPTTVGVYLGTRIRKRTSERSFRLVFLVSLCLLGIYIVTRSVLAL